MAVTPTDLIAYASANMPDTNSATSGGAINPDVRVVFTPLSADDTIQAVSSNAGDTTQDVTVEGRDANGTIVTETKTLTGATPITFSTLGTVDRVLSVSMSADALGTVTIQTSGAVPLGTIPVGERGFLYVHRKGQASTSSTEDFYYKVFLKNTNGSSSFTSGIVSETADPAGRVTFALAGTINDTGSTANRKTSPGLTFNGSDKNVPATLTAGDAIGVWLLFSHPAGDTSKDTTVTLQIAGGTT